MGGKLLYGVVVFMVSCLMTASTLFHQLAYASTSCKDAGSIDIVYVRGSGESYNERYFKAIEPALKMNLSADKFELRELTADLVGEENDQYLALAVLGDFEESYTGAAALLSSGDFGKYKASVLSGVSLLKKYLGQLSKEPNECVVLLGYSQGAQVIGDALEEVAQVHPGLLDRVIYIGLFGDPKLDLRGEGLSFGSNLPWYRGNALPVISGGSLGSRLPYLPKMGGMYLGPAGSWCYDDDFICTENYMALPSIAAHGKYPERSFSQMSLEVANAVRNSLQTPAPPQASHPSCRSGGQDVVVLLDTSPLMRRDITLFANSPMSDPFHTTPTGLKLPPRTAGQMITESGCNNTRVAVVGYGRPSDGPPKVLLDFTTKAKDYDDLMKSLYEQHATGVHERTQFREGVLLALGLNWRQGAGRTIYAITNSVGSGPEWASGSQTTDQLKRIKYRQDSLTQQVIENARLQGTVIIGHGTRSSYHGFVWDSQNAPSDHRNYLDLFAMATGGYNWVKEWPNYSGYSYKLTRLAAILDEAYERNDSLTGTGFAPRMNVGVAAKLSLSDTSATLLSARVRGESLLYKWYVDCGDMGESQTTTSPELLITPKTPGACQGSVVVESRLAMGNGCYSGCPEPFPAKYVASIPLKIDIKPVGYVPLIPGPIQNLKKYMYENHIRYEWTKAHYAGEKDPVYTIRDDDGYVLALTTGNSLTVTDTQEGEPTVYISALGEDGRSEQVTSSDAIVIDLRVETPPLSPPEAETGLIGLPIIESAPYVRVGKEPEPAKPDNLFGDSSAQDLSTDGPPILIASETSNSGGSEPVVQATAEVIDIANSNAPAVHQEVLAISDTKSARPEESRQDVLLQVKQGSSKVLYVIGTAVVSCILFPILIRKYSKS